MTNVTVNKKVINISKLAEYMDNELRERLNDLNFKDDQQYINTYIKYAYTLDTGFIDVLEQEFGILTDYPTFKDLKEVSDYINFISDFVGKSTDGSDGYYVTYFTVQEDLNEQLCKDIIVGDNGVIVYEDIDSEGYNTLYSTNFLDVKWFISDNKLI